MNYDYWRKALAGEKPKMFVDEPQVGFYRKAVYTKEPNKAAKRTGWTPVAVFLTPDANMQGVLTAVIGNRQETDRDKINELWSYCAANPISEETYRAVAERGEPWPDSHETVPSISVANSTSMLWPLVLSDGTKIERHEAIGADLEEASKHLAKFAVIESDEQSSKARSLQQRFLDLRGEAKKHYDALNDPLLAEQKRIRGIWFPIRDRADEAATKLREAMGKWEDEKRKAAKVAAERAEAGQPAASNVPPPSPQIKGGTGRAASVKVETVVTSIDVDKVFEQFKTAPQVVELLNILAQKAIRAGIPVPGAVTEERSVVR